MLSSVSTWPGYRWPRGPPSPGRPCSSGKCWAAPHSGNFSTLLGGFTILFISLRYTVSLLFTQRKHYVISKFTIKRNLRNLNTSLLKNNFRSFQTPKHPKGLLTLTLTVTLTWTWLVFLLYVYLNFLAGYTIIKGKIRVHKVY